LGHRGYATVVGRPGWHGTSGTLAVLRHWPGAGGWGYAPRPRNGLIRIRQSPSCSASRRNVEAGHAAERWIGSVALWQGEVQPEPVPEILEVHCLAGGDQVLPHVRREARRRRSRRCPEWARRRCRQPSAGTFLLGRASRQPGTCTQSQASVRVLGSVRTTSILRTAPHSRLPTRTCFAGSQAEALGKRLHLVRQLLARNGRPGAAGHRLLLHVPHGEDFHRLATCLPSLLILRGPSRLL